MTLITGIFQYTLIASLMSSGLMAVTKQALGEDRYGSRDDDRRGSRSVYADGFGNGMTDRRSRDREDYSSDRFSSNDVCDSDAADRGSRKSYAEQLSQLKEEINSSEDEMDSLKDEISRLERLGKKISDENWAELDDEDPILSRYGAGNCECSAKTQCKADALIAIDAVTNEDFVTYVPKGCVDNGGVKGFKGKAGTGSFDDPRGNVDAATKLKLAGAAAPATLGTDGALDGTEPANGTGGGNSGDKGKGKGGGRNCSPISDLSPSVNRAAVCKAVYDYYVSNRRDPYSSSTNLRQGCIDSAKKCGPVRREIEAKKIPGQLKDLRDQLAKLNSKYKRCVAKRRTIDRNCPDCGVIADQVDNNGRGNGKKTVGDYILGGLAIGSPVLMKGMDMAMFYKQQNTAASAYNNYLGSNTANCQAYISQGTTLGIPSNPCMSSMWASGTFGNTGYGSIGYGSIGLGSIGYGSIGLGSIGYGNIAGSIGYGIGSAIGYGSIPGGIGYAGPQGIGGYGISGGIGGYGISGGIGYAGIQGISGYGVQGNSGYGIQGISGYGVQGNSGYGIQGISGYGVAGGISGYGQYGQDPAILLNQQRAQMQAQNIQLAGTQATEAMSAYQRVAGQMTGGYGYGNISGGYGIGGVGYGGVGYGGAVGYGNGGYYPAYTGYGGYGSIGTAIGTAIGTVY
ncbi:MAG: hypothetical protein H7301_09865 [Cryobacterium sp.]|nr:hypothetical protein [Oligoflexia bacterium]